MDGDRHDTERAMGCGMDGTGLGKGAGKGAGKGKGKDTDRAPPPARRIAG